MEAATSVVIQNCEFINLAQMSEDPDANNNNHEERLDTKMKTKEQMMLLDGSLI